MNRKPYDIICPYGKHAFVVPHPNHYNCVLRIFNYKESDNWNDLETFMWGDLPVEGEPNMSVGLLDATKIQNFCWLEGLAPRVEAIERVTMNGRKYWAQRIHKLNKYAQTIEEAEEVYRKVAELGELYGFTNEKEDVSRSDVMDGKLVDFNTFHFTPDHKQKIAKLYSELGKYGETYYHAIPELGLNDSPRSNDHRIMAMKLNEIDYAGKAVLDIGCAGGFFVRDALDRGAEFAIGLDYPGFGSSDPTRAAFIVSIELCDNFGFEFLKRDLSKGKPLLNYDTFSIVYFLSLNFHIGIPEWLPKVTGEMCIFEDNSKERDALPTLQKMFKRVKLVGTTYDHDKVNGKPVYHCFVD